MEKKSPGLTRRPSFSYAAAKTNQKDPSHVLGLVDSVRDEVSQNPLLANQASKVLYKKLGKNDLSFLTTNAHSDEQQDNERDPQRYEGQRQAAINQVSQLATLWCQDSDDSSNERVVAEGLIALCATHATQNEGLPCTAQLQRHLRTLNEAYQAQQATSPRKPPRSHHVKLPSLNLPRRKRTTVAGLPPVSSSAAQSQVPPSMHSPRPSSPKPLPKPPLEKPTAASQESETDTSSSVRDGSLTKRGSPKQKWLQKTEKHSDMSHLRAVVQTEMKLGNLQDLFFPPCNNAPHESKALSGNPPAPAEHDPSTSSSSEDSVLHTPASDRPTTAPEEQRNDETTDDAQTRATSTPRMPTGKPNSLPPPRFQRSFLQYYTRPTSPRPPANTEQQLPSASQDQTPPTDTH